MAEVRVNIGEVIGKGYKAFWNSRTRYLVLKGGKASKKSTTASLRAITNLMQYPESNLLVVRAVFNTHAKSTFAQLKWAINRLGVSEYWKATVSPLEITYKPTGQKILFAGFDDWQKVASTTVSKGYLCWAWIEEGFELTNESDFINLDLSVPRGRVPSHLWKETLITFNPWSEKHWLKKRFFDEPHKNVTSLTTNYLCNEFLDEIDREIYEEMKEKNPRKYSVAGLGDWGISEGLIYDNWEVKSFDKSNIGGDDKWKYKKVYGLDHGYNDPEAFIAMAVNPLDKIIYIFDEHYQSKMSSDDVLAMLARKGVLLERIMADGGGMAKTLNEDLRRRGATRLTAATKGKGSIMKGVRVLQDYKIYVHPDCSNTIAELSSYVFDTKNDTPKDKPADKDNHLMDSMRYAMEDITYFKPKSKSEKSKGLMEKYRRQRRSGNLISSHMRGGWS